MEHKLNDNTERKKGFFKEVLGETLAKEQTEILSKIKTVGIDSLSRYECGRLIANRTMSYPSSQELNGEYSIFENYVNSAKERLELMCLPLGIKGLYKKVLTNDERTKQQKLLSIKNKGETLSDEELNILKKGLEQTTTYLLEHYFSKEKTFVRYDSKGKKLHSLPKKQWEKYVSMVLGTNNSINSQSETEQRSNYIGLEKLTDLSHNAD